MLKKSLSRVFTTIILLMLVVGLAVSACSSANDAPETVEVVNNSTDIVTNESTDDEGEDTVEEEEPSEPITIKYTVVAGPTPDMPLVQEALNELIHERLDPNINIELDYLDWGEYLQTVNLRFSAGEECDIVFTPKWMGLFFSNQAQGALAPLEDYMGDFPALENEIAPLLPSTTIDGHIYGIPGNQQVVTSAGVGIRTDLLEKYPLDWDTINTYEDIEPYLLDVIEKEPEIEFATTPTENFRPGYYGYDNITTGIEAGVFTNGILGVQYDDETLTVVNLLKTDDFREYVERTARWYDLGIISNFHDDDAYANFRTKYILYMHYQQPHSWWNADYPYFGKSLAPSFIGNFRAGENTTSICATSQHPKEAYQVYAFINSDPDAFNTIVNGIEGTHWNWVDKDKNLIEVGDVETMLATYFGPADWEIGNQFISYYRSPEQAEADIWAMERELNATADSSVLLGFVLDTEPILTEISQVSAVVAEFAPNLVIGWEEDWEASLDQLIQLTDDAGMDVIVAEVQSQVDAWAASQ